MPIIPSVFQPIRSNDYQQRPIKTYKHYAVRHDNFTTSSGYFRHDALYRKVTPHIIAETGLGVDSLNFLVNAEDNTCHQVVWNTIDNRYYRNYNAAQSADFSDIEKQVRFIFHSASVFTAPYGQVGEKIKIGSYEITSSLGSTTCNLRDDANGNLRDDLIISASFASSSRNFFHMSFNSMYRNFNDFTEIIDNDALYSGSGVPYELNHVPKKAESLKGILVTEGVSTTGFRPAKTDEIVRNGDFVDTGLLTNTSYDLGFHSPDNGLSISSSALNLNNPSGGGFDGRAYFANTAGTGTLYLPLGKVYRLTYTVTANSSGASLFLYDGDNYNALDGSVGTHTHDFTPHSDGNPIVLRNATDNTLITLDDVSLREVEVPKSGLAAALTDGQYIRIPHDPKFDRFGKCDDWSISFWYMTPNTASLADKEIITKYALVKEAYLDKVDGKRKLRDVEFSRTTNFNQVRTPFSIFAERSSSNSGDSPFTSIKFVASEGTEAFSISSSKFTTEPYEWNHVMIRNSASLMEIFIDGSTLGSTSGSLPQQSTLNSADIMIGSPNSTYERGDENNQFSIAEIRMYDYAVDSTGVASLANADYLSGSLYQTNIAGNVFYKNGQVVVSSVMPKYHSGSGFFSTDRVWNLRYRGVHTIYENECLVRVPKDQFNVTMNPTSTYRPPTEGEACSTNEVGLPPGELRKGLFISGTLKPYITTVGLYNDKCQMLATAKLAQPIQKSADTDLNFILRWDY